MWRQLHGVRAAVLFVDARLVNGTACPMLVNPKPRGSWRRTLPGSVCCKRTVFHKLRLHCFFLLLSSIPPFAFFDLAAGSAAPAAPAAAPRAQDGVTAAAAGHPERKVHDLLGVQPGADGGRAPRHTRPLQQQPKAVQVGGATESHLLRRQPRLHADSCRYAALVQRIFFFTNDAGSGGSRPLCPESVASVVRTARALDRLVKRRTQGLELNWN